MLSLTAVGRLGRDAETRQAGSGTVTSFSIAVDTGFGSSKATVWLECSMWGDRGEKIREYLTKGTLVAVSGEAGMRTYNEKTSMTCRTSEVKLLGGNRDRPESRSGGGRQAAPPQNDIEGDVPFAWADCSDEIANHKRVRGM